MDLRRMALRIATHLGAGAIGVACWWGFVRSPEPSVVSAAPSQEKPGTASRTAAVREALQDRIAKDTEERRKTRESMDRRVRDAALEVIANGPEEQRKKETRLAELRSLADTYRNTADLHRVLADALVAEENDSGIAIFLEWHRRDPDGAFDELAKLSDWSGTVLSEDAVALAVGTSGLVAQLAKEERPDEFWRELVGLCGKSMGENDQLEALADAFAQVPPDRAEVMIAEFLLNWVPDEGAEAARFLVQAPENFRRRFLNQLKNGSPSAPQWGWTDEFAAALLGADLGPCEDLRVELAGEDERTGNPVFSSCLPPSLPLPAIVKVKEAGWIEGVNETEGLERLVGQLLYRNRDYPELFASGEMDLPAIHAAMLEQMEGAEAFPEAIAAALFKGLALQRPEEAMEWARDKLPQEKITRISTVLIAEADEPRLSRVSRLLKALPTRAEDIPNWKADHIAEMRGAFREWPHLAQSPGTAALAEIPEKSLFDSSSGEKEDKP